MNTKLLIHAIMRQTTVLIAELSTTAGIRAPLAHLADQVFVNLAKEIEAQGVGRKVAADMFGLALRTYQTKVQRLSESVTNREMTLWQAVLDFLRENGSTARTRLFHRFRNDSESNLRAVLNDLVTSGLVYATGRGDGAIYGMTSEADQNRVLEQQDAESVSSKACGEKLSCICGVCTDDCSQQSDCDDYGASATCTSVLQTPLSKSCQSDLIDESFQACVLPCQSKGDCSQLGDDAACVEGQCINRAPLTTPNSGFPAYCDPLEAIDQPLRLGDFIVAAKNSLETIYAAYETDDDSGDYLLFVSEGDILYRKFISGSGEGRDGDNQSYLFSVVEEESDGFTLLVEIDADDNMTAALVRDSDYEGRIDEIGGNGELLEVLDSAKVEMMEKQNLPGIVSIEYLAEVQGGKTIVVTRPEYDWSYEDFKLYYGTAKEMKQLTVLEVLRAQDGGSTWITFQIDSSTAEVAFPVNLTPDGVEWEPATLTIDDQEYAVTRLDTDAIDLSEFTFVCNE